MQDNSEQMVKPSRCFCHIPIDDLKKWAFKKYVGHEQTMKLLAETDNEYEKELIVITALLDLDEETLENNLGHLTRPGCNLSKCRHFIKDWLVHMLEKRK